MISHSETDWERTLALTSSINWTKAKAGKPYAFCWCGTVKKRQDYVPRLLHGSSWSCWETHGGVDFRHCFLMASEHNKRVAALARSVQSRRWLRLSWAFSWSSALFCKFCITHLSPTACQLPLKSTWLLLNWKALSEVGLALAASCASETTNTLPRIAMCVTDSQLKLVVLNLECAQHHPGSLQGRCGLSPSFREFDSVCRSSAFTLDRDCIRGIQYRDSTAWETVLKCDLASGLSAVTPGLCNEYELHSQMSPSKLWSRCLCLIRHISSVLEKR